MASEQELEQVARDVNVLASFLGMRDVPSLTPKALDERYGVAQADVMALFGGSILAGGDVLADAMRASVARTYVIVGGAGHTTETFREKVRELCPDLTFAGDATRPRSSRRTCRTSTGSRRTCLRPARPTAATTSPTCATSWPIGGFPARA